MPDFQIRLGMYVYQTATVNVSADTLIVAGASHAPGREVLLTALPLQIMGLYPLPSEI